MERLTRFCASLIESKADLKNVLGIYDESLKKRTGYQTVSDACTLLVDQMQRHPEWFTTKEDVDDILSLLSCPSDKEQIRNKYRHLYGSGEIEEPRIIELRPMPTRLNLIAGGPPSLGVSAAGGVGAAGGAAGHADDTHVRTLTTGRSSDT